MIARYAHAVRTPLFLVTVVILLFVILGCTGGQDTQAVSSTTVTIPSRQSTAEVAAPRSAAAPTSTSTTGLAARVIPGDAAEVVKVVDGDTIEVRTGGRIKRVRYIGIDTPETKHPRVGVECYGREAAAANRKMVEGQRVTLEKDVSETDRYGRLLRYVWIGETMVNDRLVRMGFAVSSAYPPDVKHQSRFRASERTAREADAGLWGSCGGADTPAHPKGVDSVGSASKSSSRLLEARPDPADTGFDAPACAKSDCDCGDFRGDSAWATWFLRSHDPGNSHRLDGDRDGMACEG